MDAHFGYNLKDYEKASYQILKAVLKTISDDQIEKIFCSNAVLKKLEPDISPMSDLKLYLHVIKTS